MLVLLEVAEVVAWEEVVTVVGAAAVGTMEAAQQAVETVEVVEAHEAEVEGTAAHNLARWAAVLAEGQLEALLTELGALVVGVLGAVTRAEVLWAVEAYDGVGSAVPMAATEAPAGYQQEQRAAPWVGAGRAVGMTAKAQLVEAGTAEGARGEGARAAVVPGPGAAAGSGGVTG